MVAEQRETVHRIDADTHDIASNVDMAQRELLKYYASISSNRWLMLKVFGVLIVFVSDDTSSQIFDHLIRLPVPRLHSSFIMLLEIVIPLRFLLTRWDNQFIN